MIHKNLFLLPEILSRLIFTQSENGGFYVRATEQQKPRRALPEEIIRQLFILSLVHHYGYPEDNIRLEYGVQMGRTRKRADIVILDNEGNPYMVVEVKQGIDQATIDRLESYVTITRASFGVAVSSNELFCINNSGAYLDDLPLFWGSNERPNPNGKSYSINPQTRPESQIEAFERINQTHAKITIKGHTVKLSNMEMADYKILHKNFIKAGVVIDPRIKQQDWLTIFSHLLETNPVETVKPVNIPLVLDEIEIFVSELLENSNDPLYSNDVICFTPLFEKIRAKLPTVKNDQVLKLSRALSNLGFSKLARIRIRGEQQSVWVKRTYGFDPTIDWAKNIIESRLKAK